MAATAAATADTAPSDTSARPSTPGEALGRGRGLMRRSLSRKLGTVAWRVKRDYRSDNRARSLPMYARHHRVLCRLKLRASGRRSGGRNSQGPPARGRQADPILGRRVRSRGRRAPPVLQEIPRAPRRARRSAAPDREDGAAGALRIAISTGGGDAPGLNAVIRGAVLAALHRGWECVGIRRGYDGLLDEDRVVVLDANAVRGITHLGGTILGTTNRGDPFRWRGQRADGTAIEHDRADELVAAFHRKGIDALIAIGGGGPPPHPHRPVCEKGDSAGGRPQTDAQQLRRG